jgi:two-component system chemotaxis response regulator CheB
MNQSNSTAKSPISLLIVDDSLVFRRFLTDVFSDGEEFEIVGEAQNGIEALDLILKVKPDVILLDLEMPLMDGQTTLQHLMIHKPTPTIMFSSLTSEGTARCFDSLKNGAIDFVCKDFIFVKQDLQYKKSILIEKVKNCAQVQPRAREPILTRSAGTGKRGGKQSRVVFCEDCGNREVVTISLLRPQQMVTCSNCGDQIDIQLASQSKYRRTSALAVFGGGDGSFFNLLEIIPKIDADTSAAFIVVIEQSISTQFPRSMSLKQEKVSRSKAAAVTS